MSALPPSAPSKGRRRRTGIIAAVVLCAAIAVLAAFVIPRGAGDVAAPKPSPSTAPSASPTPKPTIAPVVRTCPGATSTPAPDPEGIPTIRAVNVGVEDLVSAQPGRLAEIAKRLDEVNANTVSISVGRLDWIEFPSPGREADWSSDVTDTGRDYVGEAVNAFRCAADGRQRRIILGVDTLFGRDLKPNPQLAGHDQSGAASDLFASLSAWKTGGLRDRLAGFARELAERYHPDGVNITELMFDQFTFGSDDLADFRTYSGLSDWPRNADGSVDTHDPAVSAWRTAGAVSVCAASRAALDPLHVDLTIDVRSPISADHPSRDDVGQGYPELLTQASRLNLWDFPGINGDFGAFRAAELGPMLFDQNPTGYSLEIGVWQGSTIIPVDLLRQELTAANAAGIRSVSVTPASLFTDEMWSAIAHAWGR